MRRAVTALLSSLLLLTPALAAAPEPFVGTTAMTMDVVTKDFPRTFSVTVPTVLAGHVDGKGVVTVGDTVSITNNSTFPVGLEQIKVTMADGWELGTFGQYYTPDSKTIGMQLKFKAHWDEQVVTQAINVTSDTVNVSCSQHGVIFNNESISFDYNFSLPIYSENMNKVEVAQVSFIINHPRMVDVTTMAINDDYICTGYSYKESYAKVQELPPIFEALGSTPDFSYGLVLPESCTTIKSNSLNGHVTHLYIPNSVTTIENTAFRSNSSIHELRIPSSVTEIGTTAFSYARQLKKIYIDAPTDSIPGAPWGAANAEVVWNDTP